MSTSSSAGALADTYYVQTCKTDFIVIGMQGGEAEATITRIVCTMVTVSLISSWCNARKIKRLLLFFSHWLSGLTHQISALIMNAMISVCWSKSQAFFFIKMLKFVELASLNMLAVTNLAICVNLALIVSSHRTMTRVQSVSSPRLILYFATISLVLAAAVVPFWEDMVVSQTLYWATNFDERLFRWILTSMFLLELLVGLCMLIVVSLLLIFRLPEIRECWKLHSRIRFYFGLTGIAIAVNLFVGFGGLVVVLRGWQEWGLLISISWALRHVHIALDTLVLYGVLGVSSTAMDERAAETAAGTKQLAVATPLAKGKTGGRVLMPGSSKAARWKVTQGRSCSPITSAEYSSPRSSSPDACSAV